MSFIQMSGNFSTVQEKKPVPKGLYDLTIENAEGHKSKETGKPSIKVTLEIEGSSDAPKVIHYVSLPSEEDDGDKVNNKMLMIKRFLLAFNIEHEDNGFNIEDFIGAKGHCELTLTDPDEPGANGMVYNRLNLPRLADEGPVGGAAKAPAAKKS